MNRLVVWLALAGCSSAAPVGTTYYKDIKPLVEEKCLGCHVEDGIAPFSLEDYPHVRAVRDRIKVAVKARVMPPWLAAPGCADYVGDRSLSDAQIALLTGWIEAGAAEGEPSQYRAPAAQPKIALSRVDATLMMTAPYLPALSPDEYRCFVIDWPATTTQFVTGFRARPGNAKIVHHVIAFLAQPADVATFQMLDAADPAPGYSCFGGAGGSIATRWVGAWAPGSLGSDYPPDTGLRIEPGSKIVLQVHYNTATTRGETDQTALDFKMDPAVAKEAVIQPYTNLSWVLGRTMTIPAGVADVEHDYAIDLTQFLNRFSNGALADGVPTTIWSASLHMHVRGDNGRLRLDHPDGTSECLLDIPHWNFHWQGAYGFAQPKTMRPGDKLYLECHWNNSPEAQPYVNGVQVAPTDENWGEGTGDEMCLGGFYLTQ
jgi:hypothetical protein